MLRNCSPGMAGPCTSGMPGATSDLISLKMVLIDVSMPVPMFIIGCFFLEKSGIL